MKVGNKILGLLLFLLAMPVAISIADPKDALFFTDSPVEGEPHPVKNSQRIPINSEQQKDLLCSAVNENDESDTLVPGDVGVTEIEDRGIARFKRSSKQSLRAGKKKGTKKRPHSASSSTTTSVTKAAKRKHHNHNQPVPAQRAQSSGARPEASSLSQPPPPPPPSDHFQQPHSESLLLFDDKFKKVVDNQLAAIKDFSFTMKFSFRSSLVKVAFFIAKWRISKRGSAIRFDPVQMRIPGKNGVENLLESTVLIYNPDFQSRYGDKIIALDSKKRTYSTMTELNEEWATSRYQNRARTSGRVGGQGLKAAADGGLFIDRTHRAVSKISFQKKSSEDGVTFYKMKGLNLRFRPENADEGSDDLNIIVGMSKSFGLKVNDFLAVLTPFHDLEGMSELTSILQQKLPPGFPVELKMPTGKTMRMKVKFREFKWRQFNESLFTVPQNCRPADAKQIVTMVKKEVTKKIKKN